MRHPLEADSTFAARFTLEAPLGAGGSARVFRGTQRSTGQAVAVKIMEERPGVDASDSAERLARFRRETRLCAGLHHPNLVRLIDAGAGRGGWLYCVFDYVPGRSLDRLLAEEGALEPVEATRLLTEVLDAIGCAHRQGIVHRDLKPSNVMISETGLLRHALVLDFGVGASDGASGLEQRGAAAGGTPGTPAYAAPEQLRGEAASAASDLYSWGLIALECLTGARAIRGASLEEVLAAQLGAEPVEVPDPLRVLPIGRAVAAAVAKTIEERVSSARELLALLRGAPEPLRDGGSTSPRGRTPFENKRHVTVLSLRASPSRREVGFEPRDAWLRSLEAPLLDAIREYGGSVVAKAGSRIVAVFGYPRAREEAARAALQAAASAREAAALPRAEAPGARIHAGIYSGVVSTSETDAATAGFDPFASSVVDAAISLETRARECEVLVSDATRAMLRGAAPLEPAGVVEIDGVEEPLAVYRLSSDRSELRGSTIGNPANPMIGRDEELRRLDSAWQRVHEGSPEACLIAGEAGIGKSRLLRELRRRVGDRSWIEGRCTPETQHSPLQPIVDWLSEWARGEPLDRILEELGLDVAVTHPLLAELIGLPTDARFPPRPLSPLRRRERTMQAIQEMLFAAARRRPLAFVIEDLHWADPTTLDLLAALVREIRTAGIFAATPDLPLLVLLSARPEFAAPWSPSEVPRLDLARLGRRDAESLARTATTGIELLPEEALDRFVRRADGIPLFLEEIGRMMSESLAVGIDALERDVPATLGDILGARIDRLQGALRRTIQTAACVGRDFDVPLLQSVSDRGEATIRDDLDALIRAGLVFRRTRSRPERFVFHHSLLRDVAHESMPAGERRGAHLRIAQALQGQGYEDVAAQQPERLAYHFEEAGLIDPSIEFRRRAGRRYAARSAFREALHHFGRALDLLRTLAESSERDERELELQLSIGDAYINTQGYAAEPVAQSFERALGICNRSPETPRLFSAVNGLWGYHLVRGDPETTWELVARQRDLAARATQPIWRLLAAHAEGTTAFYAGELDRGLAVLTEATSLYEAALEEHLGGGDRRPWRTPATSAPMYLGWCLHLVGRPEEGLARQSWALERAERLLDAYGHVEAMTHMVALLHDRREPEKTLELSDRIVALSDELGFRFWLGIGKSARGWARSQLGEVDAGTAEIEAGLEIFRRTGSMVPLVYRLSYLVEAHLAAGRLERGFAVIDLAFERSRGRLDRFYDAEMVRLRGELLQRAGEPARAEAELERAIGLARTQGARLLELRAATTLARLRAAAGRRDAARQLLDPVYRAFEEGFATPDLRDAAEFLKELGAAA